MAYSTPIQTAAGSSNGVTVTSGAIDTTTAKLIALCLTGTSDSSGGPNDSQSNTWTALTAESVGGGEYTIWYYCINPTTNAAHTFSWTPATGTRPCIAVLAFPHDGTPAFDQENAGGNNFGSTVQPGSVTPSENDCVIVQGVSFNVNGTFTINSSYVHAGDGTDYISNDGTNRLGIAVAYIIQTTAGATNPTWTHSPGGSSLAAVGAVFKADGGASFVPFPRPRGAVGGMSAMTGGL